MENRQQYCCLVSNLKSANCIKDLSLIISTAYFLNIKQQEIIKADHGYNVIKFIKNYFLKIKPVDKSL